jgi:pyruvate/2-oxoglutarate dehydrogenase complex dihydrolipoamide acyltransferase (E2) component
MRVVLQGSLQYFAVKELFAFLGTAHSGTFEAESSGERVRLGLRDGQIVAAEGAEDPAGVVAKLLGWSDGAFMFSDEVVEAVGTSREVNELIAEAEERNAEARRVTDLYPDANVKFQVVKRPPGEINITAEEFQLLFQIGSGKSLAELRADSGRNAVDLYPIVKRLQMTGLIEALADPEATAREPKPVAEVVPEPAPSPPPEPEPAPAPPPVEAAQPAPALVGTLTTDDGTMHPLLEESSTIGRTGANTIALGDASVSAKHARVIRTAEGFMIEDVGSRNGTFVNSEKISEKRLLADGDLIRLGKIILTFNLAVEAKRHRSTERQMLK